MFGNVNNILKKIYWRLKKRWSGTRDVYIEISLVSWNLPNGPKHWGSILRNMASSEGDQLLKGAFHAILDKIEADILQIAKKWNGLWIFTHQRYFFQKNPWYKCQFCTKWRERVKYEDVPTIILKLKRDGRTNSS